jgi:predicted Zn-dependent protease
MNNCTRLFISIIFYLLPINSYAEFNIIRDAEIESSLKALSSPLFKAAGYDENNIKFFIVDNPTINAFVGGSDIIFIHSGLLTKFYNDPEILLGVIAHELGHIKGGHINKLQMKHSDISKTTLVSSVLLGAAAIAGSSPEIMMAILTGTLHVGEREMLRYSREQEEAADQIAVKLLDKTSNSASGLKRIMEYFKKNDFPALKNLNPYSLTHPLPKQRFSFIEHHLQSSKITTSAIPIKTKNSYITAMIKLKSYLAPSPKTLKELNLPSDSADYLYSKAIIEYRNNHVRQAIETINQLINKEPGNIYFYELKAQILFENGDIEKSLECYNTAINLNKEISLIAIEYAMALIESLEKNDIKKNQRLNLAINILTNAINNEAGNIMIYRQLATAYGKLGDLGMANFYLAEQSIWLGDKISAKRFAKFAMQKLAKSSIYYIKAQDILEIENNS